MKTISEETKKKFYDRIQPFEQFVEEDILERKITDLSPEYMRLVREKYDDFVAEMKLQVRLGK